MSTCEQNKAAAETFLKAVEHGNLDTLDAIVGPDYVLHDPSMPEEVRGLEGAKQMLEALRSAFRLRVTIEHQLAEGDHVATRYTMHGRHDAEFMGVPPSGRQGSVAGICISRFRAGKIVQEWEVWDALGLLQQIGALPEPGQLPTRAPAQT